MSSEIIAFVTELKDLSLDIKRRAGELSKLRKRKDEIEKKICEFLVQQDQPGVKYRDVAVILEKNKYKRLPKKKAQKEEDAVNVLKHYGVGNAEKILAEVIETMKGEEVPKNSIRLKNVTHTGNIR
uniref:Uncharacterized protein n=1 Tax=viral metagenome TaxID=1070528 RepID=A0A6C0KGE3_9ZZZZ